LGGALHVGGIDFHDGGGGEITGWNFLLITTTLADFRASRQGINDPVLGAALSLEMCQYNQRLLCLIGKYT
jgi:hypothetical protein